MAVVETWVQSLRCRLMLPRGDWMEESNAKYGLQATTTTVCSKLFR